MYGRMAVAAAVATVAVALAVALVVALPAQVDPAQEQGTPERNGTFGADCEGAQCDERLQGYGTGKDGAKYG